MPFGDRRDGPDMKKRRMDDHAPRGRGGLRRGMDRGRGRHDVARRDDERTKSPPKHVRALSQQRERAMPSRVVQIGKAEELTEDDIRSALETFGEIRAVVSPTRETFLIEFSTLEQSTIFISHIDNHGFLIRFNTPEITYGPAQDIASAMTQLQAGEPLEANHVLQVNVLKPLYPITTKVLHTIANPHGKVLRIVIHNKTAEKVEVLIELDSILSAQACLEAINGADIYAGCCTLDVKYSKAQSLNVFKNDDETFDYTDINPTIAAKQSCRPLANAAPANDFDNGPVPHHHPLHGHCKEPDLQNLANSMPVHSSERHNEGPRRNPDMMMHNNNNNNMGPPPAVLMVHGCDPKLNPIKLFNLFCIYGDVMKIKFLMSKKGNCLVEMKDMWSADNVIRFLNGAKCMDGVLQISPSKHEEVIDFGKNGTMEDGTRAFHDFTTSRFHRYNTPEKAAKNRNVDPCRILHFFALPLEVDEDFVLKLLEDKNCPTPTSISMHRSEICSAGLLEYEDVNEAIDTCAIANHANGAQPNNGRRYNLKLAFSGRRSMPDVDDKPPSAKDKGRPRSSPRRFD